MEALLELASDAALGRPAHLNGCRECAAELERLTIALNGESTPEGSVLAPLSWVVGLMKPLESAAEISRLLFGEASPRQEIAALHPWFRDFLGEEPAARLARKISGS